MHKLNLISKAQKYFWVREDNDDEGDNEQEDDHFPILHHPCRQKACEVQREKQHEIVN